MNQFNYYGNNNFHSKKNLRDNIKIVTKAKTKTGTSNKELARTLDDMGKLKGDKKDAYIGELISNNNAVAFATDLLNFMDTVIARTSKLDETVIAGYQETISRLQDRLEQLNEKENPNEIENIYYLIADLSNKILEVSKDTKKMMMAIISGALAVAGIVLKPIIENKTKKL